MKPNGEVSNVEQKNYIDALLYEKNSSDVGSIWLEISINWHTKSQGPKKKCIHFSSGRIKPYRPIPLVIAIKENLVLKK